MKWLVMVACLGGVQAQQIDLWDLPPLRYSDTKATDSVARLAGDIDSGVVAVEGDTSLEKLRFVLKVLEVPESSQILVFSKTSKQIGLIHPRNPRCMFFSENTYVGYVPGGAIEVIAQDPNLGPVFYLIEPHVRDGFRVIRDTSDCLSCHGTTRTENAPGMLVRSVFPDEGGQALLGLGSVTVTHQTPIEQRWGGYYVTGRSDLGHLGNRVYQEGSDGFRELELEETVDLSKYPRKGSDVVALVVMEHQLVVHNLFTAAGLRYRRAHFLSKAIDPDSDPDSGQAGRIADGMAVKIVDALLFADEADLGEGLEGDPDFARDYAAQFPRSRSGRSLADFRLYRTIFKNRCSCMIYSDAFEAMPGRVKSAVMSRLKSALDPLNNELAAHLSNSEKVRISRILEETLPGWAG